jgi:hypothetical protein
MQYSSMIYKTAWVHYESSRNIARVCGVTDQAVSQWKKRGIIPIHWALVLEKDSGGVIKVDPAVYSKSAI